MFPCSSLDLSSCVPRKNHQNQSVLTLFMELIKSSLTLYLTLRCVHMYMNLCTCVNISVLRIFLMTTVTFGKTCFQVSYFNQAETKFNSKNLKLKREKVYISVYQFNCLQRHLEAYWWSQWVLLQRNCDLSFTVHLGKQFVSELSYL